MPEGMLHFLLCIPFSFYCKVMPILSRLAKVSLGPGGLLLVTIDILSPDNPVPRLASPVSSQILSFFSPQLVSLFKFILLNIYFCGRKLLGECMISLKAQYPGQCPEEA